MSMIAAGTSTRTSALVMLLAEHKATLLGRPAAAPQRSRYGTCRAESVPRGTCGAGKTVAETRCNGPAASWWHPFPYPRPFDAVSASLRTNSAQFRRGAGVGGQDCLLPWRLDAGRAGYAHPEAARVTDWPALLPDVARRLLGHPPRHLARDHDADAGGGVLDLVMHFVNSRPG